MLEFQLSVNVSTHFSALLAKNFGRMTFGHFLFDFGKEFPTLSQRKFMHTHVLD